MTSADEHLSQETLDVAADFLRLVTKHLSKGAEVGVVAGGLGLGLHLLAEQDRLLGEVIGSLFCHVADRLELRVTRAQDVSRASLHG